MLVRPDVLERLPAGGWRLVEIKSGTRLKDVFLLDVAVQLRVLRGAGLDVRDAAVLTLNRDYVYDGVRLDWEALFAPHPVFDQARALSRQRRHAGRARCWRCLPGPPPRTLHRAITASRPARVPTNAHCTRDHTLPEHGVGELPRLAARRRAELEAARIEEIRDIPVDFALSALQRIVSRARCASAVRSCTATSRARSRASRASGATPRLRETFAPAIPRFAGTRPYDPIPFLFSVHTERDGSPSSACRPSPPA